MKWACAQALRCFVVGCLRFLALALRSAFALALAVLAFGLMSISNASRVTVVVGVAVSFVGVDVVVARPARVRDLVV